MFGVFCFVSGKITVWLFACFGNTRSQVQIQHYPQNVKIVLTIQSVLFGFNCILTYFCHKLLQKDNASKKNQKQT